MAALKEPNAAGYEGDPNDALADLGIEALRKLAEEAHAVPPGDVDPDAWRNNPDGDRKPQNEPPKGIWVKGIYVTPEMVGYDSYLEERRQIEGDGTHHLITPTAFEWCDPATLPTRQFIYGRHVLRKYLTSLLAPGAVGKSSLTVVEALAIVTGRPLLGVMPNERCNVWLWNGEDPHEELQRKVLAAMLHYKIPPEEVKGRLFLELWAQSENRCCRASRERRDGAYPRRSQLGEANT